MSWEDNPGMVFYQQELLDGLKRMREQSNSNDDAAHRFAASTGLCVIQGLQSDSGQLLNGQVAQVMDWDAKSLRYIVRLNDVDAKFTWKKLKPECVAKCSTEQIFLSNKLPAETFLGGPKLAQTLLEVDSELHTIHQTISKLHRAKIAAAITEVDIWGPSEDANEPLLCDRALRCLGSIMQNWGMLILQLYRGKAKVVASVMKIDALERSFHKFQALIRRDEYALLPMGDDISPDTLSRMETLMALISESLRVSFVLNECTFPLMMSPIHNTPMIAIDPLGSVMKSAIDDASIQSGDNVESAGEAVQNVEHLEPPTVIDEEEAAKFVAEQESGFIERMRDFTSNGHTGCTDGSQDSVFLLKLNRNPKELRNELCDGPALKSCRDALAALGYLWKHSTGALFFVHPLQYRLVMRKLDHTSLKPDHIIVSMSLEYLIEEVMSKYTVWAKGRDEINSTTSEVATAGEDVGVLSEVGEQLDATAQYEIVVDRTFLCYVRSQEALATQSTTDAHSHCGRNPRHASNSLYSM